MFKKVTNPKSIFLSVILYLVVTRTQAYNDEHSNACLFKQDNTRLPFADECTSYMQCEEQKATKHSCPFGTGFNSEQMTCVPLYQSDCGKNFPKAIVDKIRAQPDLFQTFAATCVGNEQRAENQMACKGQAFGALVSYPGNCAKFLVCNCEYPTVKDCAPGTWFDNKLKVCNFPQNVQCDDGGTATTKTTAKPTTVTSPQTTPSTTTETVTTPSTSPQTTPSTTPNITTTTTVKTSTSLTTPQMTTTDKDWGINCEAPEGMSADICLKYDDNVLLRYPYNCNAYINCTQGCPVMTYCLPDKVFNNLLKICDTPETAHCETLPMPSTTTTEAPTTAECEPVFGICDDICDFHAPGTLLPYPYNCSDYIHCNWRCPQLKHCASGEVFNAKLGKCDKANNVECTEKPMVCEPPDGISGDICSSQDPGTLLPNPYNCSDYILCNWRCPFLKHCVAGEVFNAKLGKCDKAGNVECTEKPMVCEPPDGISGDICSSQDPGTLLPNPYNCSDYILCNWRCPFLKHCAVGEVFNARLGKCDKAGNAECNEKPMVCNPPDGISGDMCSLQDPGTLLPNPYNCSDYILCNWRCPFLKHCAAGEVFNAKLGKCEKKGNAECNEKPMVCNPPDGISGDMCSYQDPGTLLPNPYNCSDYILCNWRCPFLKHCAVGEVFNARLGKCDKAGNAECNEKPMVCNPPDGISGDMCSLQDPGTLLPNPYNCSDYILCNWRCPFLKHCAAGEVFNAKLGKCDKAGNAECNEKPMVCDPPDGISGDICSLQDPGTLLPNPYNCSDYILCNWRCPFLKHCAAGEVFNAKLGKCDKAGNAECTEKPMVCNPPDGISGDICSLQDPGTLLPNPYNCSDYILCNWRCPFSKHCAADEVFNAKLGKCEKKGNAECSEKPMVCNPPDGISGDICSFQDPGALLPNPYNCSDYILCNWRCPFLKHCAAGEVFDAKLGKCDKAGNVECSEKPMVCDPPEGVSSDICSLQDPGTLLPYPYNCSDYILCNWRCPFLKHCAAGEVFNAKLGKCDKAGNVECSEKPMVCDPPEGVSKDICSHQDPGTLLPYPYNCSDYILCNWRCPYLRSCGDNKIFNSLLGICDSAENVQCSEMPYPTSPPDTTTTTTESSPTTSLPSDVDPGLCKNVGDYTLLPYERDCQKYLFCLKGKVELKSCPEGWLFNAELGMCDDAGEEVCYTGSTSTTVTVPTTSSPIFDLCLGQPEGTSFPYPENCQMYYFCRGNGSYYLLNCPYDNYYEPYSGDCGPDVSPTACKVPMTTTTTAATTLSPAEKCEGQEVGATCAYEANCRQYIMCMGNGRYQIQNCPYNNFYYPDSDSCGPSDDEDICRKGTEGTTITTTSRPTTTTTTESTTPGAPSNGICGNLTNGEMIEYPDNCEKYISCVRPIPIGFYCPGNWYFDVTQQNCVPDTNGTCHEQGMTTTVAPPSEICAGEEKGECQTYPLNCQMYYECLGNGYHMLKACPDGEYFDPLNGKCSPDVDDQYCHQDFDTTTPPTITPTPKPPQNVCWQKPIGSKVPYPGECSKYIVCDQPIPVGYNCPTGLEFSNAWEECVDPAESDCGAMTTPTPDTQCWGKPDFTLLPYEKNCTLFVICMKNLTYMAHCNRGQYFDSQLGECSYEANADSCLGSVANTTTSKPPSTTSPTTTVDPELGPCDGKPEGTKLPYPDNCEKYIVCRNPINIGYDCPNGLEFNAALAECVEPALANCSIPATTQAPATTTTPSGGGVTCQGLPNGATLVYPADCGKYYICLSGKPRLTECMPNSYYDPASGECDSSSETVCRETTTTPIQSTSTSTVKPTTEPNRGPCYGADNGYSYANKKDCTQFYLCLNGNEFLTNCPVGNYYNPQKGECNKETSSEACKELETTTEIATTTTNTTQAPITTPTSTTTSSTTTFTTTSTTTTTAIPTTTTTASTVTIPTTTSTTVPTTTTTTIPTTTSTTTPTTTTTTTSTSTTTAKPTTTTTTAIIPTSTTTSPSTTEHPHNDNICCDKESGTVLPYPGDDTKYVVCQYPLPKIMQCPANRIFDGKTGECVCFIEEDNAQCLDLPYLHAMAYPGDCSKYYMCLGSKARVMSCNQGWLFNATLGSCVPQELYKCPW